MMVKKKDKITWFSGNAYITSDAEFKEMFFKNRAAWDWVLRHAKAGRSGELELDSE